MWKFVKIGIVGALMLVGFFELIGFFKGARPDKIEAPLFDTKYAPDIISGIKTGSGQTKENLLFNPVEINEPKANKPESAVFDYASPVQSDSKKTPFPVKSIDEKLKNQIEDYINASAKLNFPQDPSLVVVISDELKKGKIGTLEKLIQAFSDGLNNLKKLTVPKEPKEIVDYHNLSVRVVEDFIAFLKEMRRNKGITQDLSASFVDIQKNISQANRVLEYLVKTYSLSLDSSVFQ